MKPVLVLAALLLPALAKAQTASCPPSIPENAIAIKSSPPGWRASTPSLAKLNGGGMMSGDPKQMEYLVPSSSRKSKGAGSSAWEFTPGEEKWFYCTYGTAALQLSKRMDDTATRCEVSDKLDRAGAIVGITATCR